MKQNEASEPSPLFRQKSALIYFCKNKNIADNLRINIKSRYLDSTYRQHSIDVFCIIIYLLYYVVVKQVSKVTK